MNVLTRDGTGMIEIHKPLDPGRCESPRASAAGQQHLPVSDAMFAVIHHGVALTPRSRRRLH
jgi:hypothetical protein